MQFILKKLKRFVSPGSKKLGMTYKVLYKIPCSYQHILFIVSDQKILVNCKSEINLCHNEYRLQKWGIVKNNIMTTKS
jgi:hypothetical protein